VTHGRLLFETAAYLLFLLLQFIAELLLGPLFLFLQETQLPQLLTPGRGGGGREKTNMRGTSFSPKGD
jgi:hypothetical protein